MPPAIYCWVKAPSHSGPQTGPGWCINILPRTSGCSAGDPCFWIRQDRHTTWLSCLHRLWYYWFCLSRESLLLPSQLRLGAALLDASFLDSVVASLNASTAVHVDMTTCGCPTQYCITTFPMENRLLEADCSWDLSEAWCYWSLFPRILTDVVELCIPSTEGKAVS